MRERMQNMSPEERERMRGQFGGGAEGGRRGGFGGEGGNAGGGRRQRQGAQASGLAGSRGVRSGQAAEAPPRPVFRPVWLLKDGKLEQVRLRIGINDGAMTAVLDGPIQQGALVVTGVAQAQSAQQGGNPLFGGRGFPGGGFPGGGFGGGRGGFPGGSGGGGNRGGGGGGGR